MSIVTFAGLFCGLLSALYLAYGAGGRWCYVAWLMLALADTWFVYKIVITERVMIAEMVAQCLFGIVNTLLALHLLRVRSRYETE